jgi:hypothetical protein
MNLIRDLLGFVWFPSSCSSFFPISDNILIGSNLTITYMEIRFLNIR